MVSAFNLKTDSEIRFKNSESSLWAVCYGYCLQHDQLANLISSNKEGRFIEFAKKLPVSMSKRAISCGDWCAKI